MRLSVVLMWHVLQRRWRHHDVLLWRNMAHMMLVWWHYETIGDLSGWWGNGRMDILKGSAGNGLSGSHMAMVDMRL